MRTPRIINVAVSLALAGLTIARIEGQQRSPDEYVKLLEGAERVARMQVDRVVGALALKPGMKVADLGSGSGLFTRPIADGVSPGGVAYAVDIDPGLLQIVDRRAQEAGIRNITIVQAAPEDPKLPESVDLIFICDTFHHIESRGAYLRTLRKYLNPGGRVAVIDFSESWPEGHESMRYILAQLDEWMGEAGFRRAASHGWLENSFFVIYR